MVLEISRKGIQDTFNTTLMISVCLHHYVVGHASAGSWKRIFCMKLYSTAEAGDVSIRADPSVKSMKSKDR